MMVQETAGIRELTTTELGRPTSRPSSMTT